MCFGSGYLDLVVCVYRLQCINTRISRLQIRMFYVYPKPSFHSAVNLPFPLLPLFTSLPVARQVDRNRSPHSRYVAIERVPFHTPTVAHSSRLAQNDATWSARTVNILHLHQDHHPVRPQGLLTTPFRPPWNRSGLGSSDRSRSLASRRPEIQSTILYILPYAYYIRISLPYPPTRPQCCTPHTNIHIS